MKKVFFSIVLLILTIANAYSQEQKIVEIKLIYNGYFNDNIHYKMPVLIELRDGENIMDSEIAAQKAGIIKSDCTVEIDFAEVADGDYWLVVRSGGFMPVASPNKLSLSASGIQYDFTTSSDKSVGGTSVMYYADDIWQIRAGDLNGDISVGAFDVNIFIPHIGNAASSIIPENDAILTVYETVVIGEQEWMQNNLDVAYYRNGDEIFHAETAEDWQYAGENEIGAWCYYDNDEANGETYGKLYNWYAVNDERGLAPEGWRVPSDDDWKELEMELGMSQEEADNWNWRGTTEGAKLAGNYDLWLDGDLRNLDEFNNSGFKGLPGGYRKSNTLFVDINCNAVWWSSTEYSATNALHRNLINYNTNVDRDNISKINGFSVRCIKDTEFSLSPPTLSSPENEATEQLIDFSLEWNAVENAETYSLQVSDASDFSNLIYDETGITLTEFELNDLELNTEYFWRVKALNGETESDWSEVWSFITTQYEYVIIGDQIWMQKNLDVSHYRNGDAIANVTDNDEWASLTTGAWCYYDNDEANGETYGKLYNWHAVNDERGLAPEGWHIPSDEEWKALEMELGMSQSETDIWDYRGSPVGAKLAGGYWLWSNGPLIHYSDFNMSGFRGFPGGYRVSNGNFGWISKSGLWWSSVEYNSTHAIYRGLTYSGLVVRRYYSNNKSGFSVRCIKD